MPAATTLPQSKKLEVVSIQVDPEFKHAIDMAVTARRSTLRRELTLAVAERLGIPVPAPFDTEHAA